MQIYHRQDTLFVVTYAKCKKSWHILHWRCAIVEKSIQNPLKFADVLSGKMQQEPCIYNFVGLFYVKLSLKVEDFEMLKLLDPILELFQRDWRSKTTRTTIML